MTDVTLGLDGIGECRCEEKHQAALSTGAHLVSWESVTCWACRPRIVDVHSGEYRQPRGYADRILFHEGALPPPIDYNPLLEYHGHDIEPIDDEGNTVDHWIPHLLRMTTACPSGFAFGESEVVLCTHLSDRKVSPKLRPTLNPTARDFHHMRTREEWWKGFWWELDFTSFDAGEWIGSKIEETHRMVTITQGPFPQHEWGDECLQRWFRDSQVVDGIVAATHQAAE